MTSDSDATPPVEATSDAAVAQEQTSAEASSAGAPPPKPPAPAPSEEATGPVPGNVSDQVAADVSGDSVGAPPAETPEPAAEVVAEATEGERPSARIQIGSQRPAVEGEAPAAPKPLHPVGDHTPAPPQAKSYPPPNKRGQLTDDLQAEFEAAVAGGSVEDMLEQSAADAKASQIAPETKVTARVASLHGDDIFLDLGSTHQGAIPAKQFETPPEVGAELEVVVARFNEEQGLYEANLPTAAVDLGNWDEVHPGQVVEVTVEGANKGGLECTVSNIRGFIPMGQISMYRVENHEELVGQRLACVITEANRKRKNLVLSHRALMERERKEKREQLLEEIAAGQIRDGVVRSLQDFGAFVDLGGADGLIHVSQLSWERVGHPSEVLQVGQEVKVRVEKVNKETGKIGLSYREVGENPWAKVPEKFPVGTTVKGTVTKIMQFGAFVKLAPGVEGLIHISELGHGRVHRVTDVLSEGQEVEAKVLTVDVDAQRISLSLKALMAKPERAPRTPRDPTPEVTAEEIERRQARNRDREGLKGGLGGPSGGDKFGLRW
ncbi:MAG: S1 RNA-binding domain-containing protein [Planctomycetales bacterium]|nr:S1 RNA-binding domain-containing protein [Planctomycetales bacterium]